MKIITTILFLLTTLFVNSQSLKHLDSVSASNLYVSTNKKQVLTKYETSPEPTFILFYGNGNVSNLENYDFIAFNTKNELLGFLNMGERSIVKRKMIIHHMEKDNVRFKNFCCFKIHRSIRSNNNIITHFYFFRSCYSKLIFPTNK